MRRTALMFALSGLVGALVAVPIAVYASHQFTDVPNTNPFHADIDWLADAGVTKGCSTTGYCPKDNVTREQMAAFMHRLGTNQVVDAGQLEGYTATEIGPRAAFRQSDSPRVGSFEFSQNLLVPAAGGIVLISGGVDAENFNAFDVISCEIRFDFVQVEGTKRLVSLDGDKAVNREESCQTSGAVLGVAPGEYRIAVQVESAGGTTNFRNASVWAIWIPFDGTGA